MLRKSFSISRIRWIFSFSDTRNGHFPFKSHCIPVAFPRYATRVRERLEKIVATHTIETASIHWNGSQHRRSTVRIDEARSLDHLAMG